NVGLELMDFLTQFDRAAIGKSHVQNAEVESKLFRQLQRFRVRSGGGHHVAKLAQRRRDQESNVRIIIDMKNVSSCGVVFLSSHLDHKLYIFVQAFGKISIKVRRIRLVQDVLNPSPTFKGLQMQIPNANRESDDFAGANFSGSLSRGNSASD